MPDFNEQQEERLHAAAHDMYRTLLKILDDTQNGQFASESEIIALLARIDGTETNSHDAHA